ncbi:MAG: general secretion pathway protein GspB [Gammaproteobacteria bacterium]|nr:general secretion pathway protein GspB [Gammaproteobacteria bacterium]
MSLILDALRKSDRQRNRRAQEQLRWGPGPAREARRRPRTLLVIALLLAALLLVGASAWLGSWLAAGGTSSVAESDESGAGNMENGPPDARRDDQGRGEVRALQGELDVARPAAPEPGTAGPLVAEPAASVAGTSQEYLAAPALAEMPQDFRERLPELVINVHAWTETPAQRFVLINMQRYAEGDRLKEGPRLLAITPDGAVLEFDGERFSLPQR